MREGSGKFTNQKQFIVTKEDETKNWSGFKDGRKFRCVLCGYFLKEGMVARWVYTNNKESRWRAGNVFVCSGCDGEDVVERLGDHYEIGNKRFWWMRREE